MGRYKIILWDVDGTLLNFLEAEKVAVRKCFEIFDMGICTDEMLKRYSDINKRKWQALERKELTKEEVLVGRYEEFFELEGLDKNMARPFNAEYQERLGDTCVINDDSYNLVKKLKSQGYYQCAVTNGTKVAQDRKLANSGFGELFDAVFISDEIGHEKPSKEFFDYVFDKLELYMKANNISMNEVIIVGDSLTSDIRGGNNAGIDTCWYNPDGNQKSINVNIDYEINNLCKVCDLLV